MLFLHSLHITITLSLIFSYLPVLTFYFSSPPHLFFPPVFLSFSNGPDLLEGHGANRHGANRVSGRPAVPVPAQHHHCGLHSLPGCHVLYHLSAHLLPCPLHPQLGRWRTPLQVRCYAKKVVKTGNGDTTHRWIHFIQSQWINVDVTSVHSAKSLSVPISVFFLWLSRFTPF